MPGSGASGIYFVSETLDEPPIQLLVARGPALAVSVLHCVFVRLSLVVTTLHCPRFVGGVPASNGPYPKVLFAEFHVYVAPGPDLAVSAIQSA